MNRRFPPTSGIPAVAAAGGVEIVDRVSTSGTCRLHPSRANVIIVDLRGNATFTIGTIPEARGAVSLTVILAQDTTGSRTATWPSSVDWGAAGAPTLTTTASKADVVTLLSVNGGRSWYGFLSAKGFAAP